LDDPAKIGSYNLTGCGVDEAIDLKEKDWIYLRGRCRVVVTLERDHHLSIFRPDVFRYMMRNQIYSATNPDGPQHWLARRFGITAPGVAPITPAPGCEVIHTNTLENVFLPEDYVDGLKTMTGIHRKRYVEGLWVGSENMIYPMFLRDHFTHRPEQEAGRGLGKPWNLCVVGVDAGFRHATAIMVIVQDRYGYLHVIEEWVQTQQLEADVVEACKQIDEKHRPLAFFVDPSAASLRAALAVEGLAVEKADNDVQGGIQAVRGKLVMNHAGTPGMTISDNCPDMIRGMETYESKVDPISGEPTDDPVKQNDDEADALRYGVKAIMNLSDTNRVLSQFDPAAHVVYSQNASEVLKRWRVLVPVEGGPTACIWAGVISWHKTKTKPRLYIYREYYQDGCTPEQHVANINELSADEQYEESYIDPKAAVIAIGNERSVADAYDDAGMLMTTWPKSSTDGDPSRLDNLRRLLADRLVSVGGVCPNVIRQMTLWTYKLDGDGKVKQPGRPEAGRPMAEAVVALASLDLIDEMITVDPAKGPDGLGDDEFVSEKKQPKAYKKEGGEWDMSEDFGPDPDEDYGDDIVTVDDVGDPIFG
jgi:phage terminase large subunit